MLIKNTDTWDTPQTLWSESPWQGLGHSFNKFCHLASMRNTAVGVGSINPGLQNLPQAGILEPAGEFDKNTNAANAVPEILISDTLQWVLGMWSFNNLPSPRWFRNTARRQGTDALVDNASCYVFHYFPLILTFTMFKILPAIYKSTVGKKGNDP